MKYVGSKRRMKKDIIPLLNGIIKDNNITKYYEPFVGGCNVIDDIICDKRVGNDAHEYLVSMWKELQKGWIPPTTISFDEYEHVKNNPEQYPKHYVGLVGFAATYGSKWFGGYARGYKSDGVTPRDMPAEGIRNIMSQLPKLYDVHFISGDYIKKTPIHKLNNWLIYCDPPYKNTTGYRNSIDHDVFWDWCDKLSKNNIVVVSEYTAPEHWNEVLYKSQTTKLTPDKHSDRIERIFMR